jgi:hypothetical protein
MVFEIVHCLVAVASDRDVNAELVEVSTYHRAIDGVVVHKENAPVSLGKYRLFLVGVMNGIRSGEGNGEAEFRSFSQQTFHMDATTHCVDYLSTEPESQARTTFGREGTGDGEFGNLHGIIVSSDGTIYVADTANNRVQAFGKTE